MMMANLIISTSKVPPDYTGFVEQPCGAKEWFFYGKRKLVGSYLRGAYINYKSVIVLVMV